MTILPLHTGLPPSVVEMLQFGQLARCILLLQRLRERPATRDSLCFSSRCPWASLDWASHEARGAPRPGRLVLGERRGAAANSAMDTRSTLRTLSRSRHGAA